MTRAFAQVAFAAQLISGTRDRAEIFRLRNENICKDVASSVIRSSVQDEIIPDV